MKRIFKIFLSSFLLLFCFVKCQNDDISKQPQQEEEIKKTLSITIEKGHHFQVSNPNLYQTLANASRTHDNSINPEDDTDGYTEEMEEFILDLEDIQIIEKENYTQYTVFVDHPGSDSYLVNYVLIIFSNNNGNGHAYGNQDEYQYLVYYPKVTVSGEEILDYSAASMEKIEGEILLTPEAAVNAPPRCLDGVPELVDTQQVYTCTSVPCSGNQHHAYGDDNCPCNVTVNCTPASQNCAWQTVNVWSCTGGGGSGNPDTPGNTGGGSNDPIQQEPIETVPIVPTWEKIKTCINTPSFTESLILSAPQITWLQTQSGDVTATLQSMLEENSCSTTAQDDAIEEVTNLMEYPFEQIPIEDIAMNQLDHDCASNVIGNEILRNLNAGIINTIRNTIGQDPNVTMMFDNVNGASFDGNASTFMDDQASIDSGQFSIHITFSNTYLNGNPTKLSIAANAIHEMVHAHLIYLYLKGTLLTKYPQFTNLKIKFDNYIENRSDVNKIALEDAMHVAMVDLIDTMAYALYKYAKSHRMGEVTHKYCKDVTKGIFFGTPAMYIITNDVNLQNEYIQKAQNEQNNTPDAKGKDC